MRSVNEVWKKVREQFPHAQFVYWSDILERLIFEDPDTDSVKGAKFKKADDGTEWFVIE